MIESLNTRIGLVIAFLVFSILWTLPNVVDLPKSWPFKKEKLNYGLDIQGGAHLVYGVDVNGVLEEKTTRLGRALESEFKEKNIKATKVEPAKDFKTMHIEYPIGEKEKVAKHLSDFYGPILQVLSANDTSTELKYYDNVLNDYSTQIVAQAIEVIRNRVDEFGVAEPIIAAQGRDRVLVQLPGIKDSSTAKELINKAAKLNFRIVSQEMDPAKLNTLITEAETAGKYGLGKKLEDSENAKPMTYSQYIKRLNADLKDKIPANTMVAFEKAPTALTMEAGKIPFLLKTDLSVSGDLLEDAHVGFGQYSEPIVNFRFGTDGRRLFGDLTGNNVKQLLAIVLDDVVFSAPVINERIDGQGQITLGSGGPNNDIQKEASIIATALRAGALPAALQQMEERTVGPSLGQDSIDKGKKAGMIGIVAVLLFVILWYKGFGAVAAFTLSLNVLSLLAVLNAIGATLTLPGIAGIALTVGMAVDANVIIFERIKEELAKGASRKAAIHEGFDKAFSAIFDSNITTAIAGIVLIYFGSGPVRGFGVTLIAGIVTTMITAVFVTQTMLDTLVQKFKFKNLPI